MRKCFILLVAFSLYFLPGLLAQDTTIVIERIYIGKHPQDPGYPQFLIYSNKNNLQMGFGGYVKLSGAFDFNGIVDSYDFISYNIPVPIKTPEEKRFYIDAHQSRLFTEVLGNIKGNNLRIYVEVDFYSDNYYPRLRHAYAQYKGILLGQTWSTLMDLEASPNTIDFEGPNSEVSLRTPMIRYTFHISKAIRLNTALELPNTSMTYGPPLDQSYQYIPDIIATLNYHGKWGHLQAGGVFRNLSCLDTLNNKVENTVAYGGVFSGEFKIGKNDNFMFQLAGGKGISNYIQDISGVGLDAVPEYDLNRIPKMKAVVSGGIYVAYQHYWHPKWNSTLVYGMTRVNTLLVRQGNESPYQRGQYLAINLFWEIAPPFTIATEYLWGQRENYDGQLGNANRIDFMAQYSF